MNRALMKVFIKAQNFGKKSKNRPHYFFAPQADD